MSCEFSTNCSSSKSNLLLYVFIINIIFIPLFDVLWLLNQVPSCLLTSRAEPGATTKTHYQDSGSWNSKAKNHCQKMSLLKKICWSRLF